MRYPTHHSPHFWIVLVILLVYQPPTGWAAAQYQLTPQQKSMLAAVEKRNPDIEIVWNTKENIPLHIKNINSQPLELKAPGVRDYFAANFGMLYGIRNAAQEIRTGKISTNRLQLHTLTIYQQYNNIPVYGMSLKLRLDKNRRLQSVIGKWLPDVEVNIKPKLDEQQALQAIATFLRKQNKTDKKLPDEINIKPYVSRLVIFNPGIYTRQKSASYLAYHVRTRSHVYFIDAQSGAMLYQYSNIHTVRDRATYNSDHCLTLPGTQILNETGPVGGMTPDAETQTAHDFAGTVYNYYSTTHGRDSYDSGGATIISTVHSGVMTDFLLCCVLGFCDCCSQMNAAWMPPPFAQQMVYGDGGTLSDGRAFHPFTNALDVVAHEITHGVTTNSIFDSAGDPVGLDYSGESGALNESYSDFFGAMVDRDDWLIGEDLVISGYTSGAMRNMADPTNGGLYDPADPTGSTEAGHQPDHMDFYVSGGNVHINSGIPNKVAYLIAAGGTHPYSGISVSGIGKEATENILYYTLTNNLNQTSDFLEARQATLLASTELYPLDMAKFNTIWNAFVACGICDDSIPGDCEPHVPLESREPADIVLLLDYSSSMLSAAEPGGRPKIDVLQDAVELFLRTWEIFAAPGDRADVIYFDSDVSPLSVSLQPLDVNALIAEVRARSTGVYTAMGGALQVGLSGLASGASHPSVILFTNGIQNVNPMAVEVGANYQIINDSGAWGGISSVPETPGTTLASYGVPVYIIGIGAAAAGSYHELLNDIRVETGGLLHLTTSPDLDLRRFYLDDLVAALNLGTLEIAGYEYGQLQPGQTASHNFSMNGTVTRAAFTVHWVNKPGVTFPEFTIDGPGHTNLKPTRWINGPFYRTAVFDFPYVLNKKVIPRAGDWTVHVKQSANNISVPYQAGLLLDETVIHYQVDLPRKVIWSGEEFVISTRLTAGKQPVTGMSVKATLSHPRNALGTFLSENKYTITKQRTDLLSTPAQNKLIGLLENPALRDKLVPQQTEMILYDDGDAAHGDKTANDGIYSAVVRDTRLPGLYRFTIDITGKVAYDWPVHRSQIASTIVRVKPDADITAVTTQWLRDTEGGAGTLSVQFVPYDKYKNNLGPGYAHLFRLAVEGGTLSGPVKDDLDGSYTQLIQVDRAQQGVLKLNLLGTEIAVPLQETGDSLWWIWLLLLLILLLIIFLIVRAKSAP